MAEDTGDDVQFDVTMNNDALAPSALSAPANTNDESAVRAAPSTGSGRVVKKKTKGRGFTSTQQEDGRYQGRGGNFDVVEDDEERDTDAQKSVEGWIVFVTGVHEEAAEDDVYEAFAEYGDIKQLHLNLDRRTGYVKGYALVEYESFQDASNAIKSMNGQKLLDQTVSVSWAFRKARGGSSRAPYRGRNSRR